ERLGFPFECYTPDIDESILESEPHEGYVCRLSLEKAQKAANLYPQHIIIGSDEIASCQGQILGKPLNFDNAKQQLKQLSGQKVTFSTGVCVLDAQTKQSICECVLTETQFLNLTDTEIEQYLRKEEPYFSAGSFK